ncbi:MAG: gliding motility-associated C-terminal domain-containing protein, partial [Saprospiraceae bacterium]|nr:gliding motility-associated C-terminal domain-containing protein [Saprospiraceae bacterium]
WNNGGNTATISNLGPGQYQPTITDSKGCFFVAQPITLTAPPAFPSFPVVSSTNVTCLGSNTGSVTINPTGGTPNYNFVWRNTANNNNVSAAQNPTNLPAGTYTAIATDSRGCTATLSSPVTISAPSTALALGTPTVVGADCFGENEGSISLNFQGNGWGNTTVTGWTPALPGGANPSNIAPGTYAVTVQDMGGCTTTQQVVVPGPATDITIANQSVQHLTCHNSGDGGIVLDITGGNIGAYEVAWTGGLAGTAISQLQPGVYIPTITDNKGCTKVFPGITVTAPTALAVSDTNVVSLNGATPGSIDIVSVTGGTPGSTGYNYLWSNGATTQDITGLTTAGTYSVTITDANTCAFTAEYNVPQANVLNPSTVADVEDACNADGSITLKINPLAQGPYTISWIGSAGGGSGTLNSVLTNNPTLANLSGGFYSITVTATNGNTVSLTAQVGQKAQALFSTQEQPPFGNTPTGKITITAQTGLSLTYQWSNGATTAMNSNLPAGLYTCTVTNSASGCTAVSNFTLNAFYTQLVGDLDTNAPGNGRVNPRCFGDANGAIYTTVSGGNDASYTYQWSNGATTQDIVNVAQGTYTLIVTDASGNTVLNTWTISNQSNLNITNVNELSLTAGGYQVSGDGVCDGRAQVVYAGQAGIASILWSNGATGIETNTLCGGAYSVTVTDAAGCTDVWTDALTAPPSISVESQVVTQVKCHGECNGVARVEVNGGVEPYTIKWSTGQQDQGVFEGEFSEETGLCGGSYSVTVTDDNGVTRVFPIVVNDPAPISITFATPTEPSSFSQCDGQLMVVLTGAVGTVDYRWSSQTRVGKFGNTQGASQLCAGEIVRFDVTDANGCKAFAQDTVPFPPDGCLQPRPVVTPNGDNLNDWFEITCIDGVKNNVQIFNRWGQLVFEVENYSNVNALQRWDGTRNGLALPEGVYFYILNYTDEDNNEQQVKGHINLLRG